jgi:RNA polymerase sigma factor (sigma-70 family)
VATRQLSLLLEQLRKTIRRQLAGGLADGALLERFVRHKDEAAFEVLVWRHGPLVLSLCQRLLHNVHDAEDALQASFLTLVKKAGSIGKRDSLGSWLYKVAQRIALRMMDKTRKAAPSTDAVENISATVCAEDRRGSERGAMLDDAIAALPEKYRTPVVLYYLQGKSQKEIAEELGCPLKTVSTRLARARLMLRKYVARRGAPLTAGLLSAGLAQRAVSAPVGPLLVLATVQAAANVVAGHALTGIVSARVAALTEGVRTMFMGKLKAATVAMVVVAVVLFLRPVWTPAESAGGEQAAAAPPRPAQDKPPPRTAPDNEPAKLNLTKETRRAIDKGLRYLAKEQAEDGAWGSGNFKDSTGITAVVGLAFLAAGHRPGQRRRSR